uniref:Uncharacterized protein n=1 Tax=Anopheles minimus TaxID=112268 RepID=A0A182WQ99_9DIPT
MVDGGGQLYCSTQCASKTLDLLHFD